jgi:hypothetical protein
MQYHRFMPPPVRVIGCIDLAEKVHEAFRAAGFDSEVVTAGPMASTAAPLALDTTKPERPPVLPATAHRGGGNVKLDSLFEAANAADQL